MYIWTHVSPFLKANGDPILRPDNHAICWLDEFLGGALHRPEGFPQNKPLVTLICGSPGAGKSLLSQQMCYSRARHAIFNAPAQSEIWPRMVYISTESPAAAIAANMQSLGWEKNITESQYPLYWDKPYPVKVDSPRGDAPTSVRDPIEHPLPIPPLSILYPESSTGWGNVSDLMDAVNYGWKTIGSQAHPDTLIIDSLNTLTERMQRKKRRSRSDEHDGKQSEHETEWEKDAVSILYERLTNLDPLPSYLFLLLDSPGVGSDSAASKHEYWEYRADVIIKLNYSQYDGEYFSRHLEIVKTRFQSHVLGKQLFKIYPKDEPGPDPKSPLNTDPEGARPHMDRGGLFLFPSEHYILSKVRSLKPLFKVSPKRPDLKWAEDTSNSDNTPAPWGPGDLARPIGLDTSPSREVNWDQASTGMLPLNWPVRWCYELVGGGGIPVGTTTAIIGRRGLHKSYFCYQFILDGVCNKERTLIVSFRDSPDAVTRTLERLIVGTQYRDKTDDKQLKSFNKVLYQRPGYVSPEEFIHRVMTAIGEHAPTRVMIAAVDQWNSAYPLLAKSRVLVPAIIDFLNAHGATSLIVGVNSGPSDELAGLTSKSEVVLEFDHRNIEWSMVPEKSGERASEGYAIDGFPEGCNLRKPSNQHKMTRHPKVVVNAVRVPHGSAGLARAVLEYELSSDKTPAGLRMIPLAPEYPIGDQL